MRSSLWFRRRVLPVLVALGCVLLAAVALRVSEPGDFQVVRGPLGQTVTVNEGEVTVEQLQVGDALLERGDIAARTPGMFVVVHVVGAATGPDTLRLTASRLTSGDRSYLPYATLSGVTAVPGFQTAVDLVFEVDPARIDGLTLELWQNEVVSGYQQRVQVPLGVTRSTADQLRRQAHVPVVEPDVNGTTTALR
jgi:hypothetical protein